MKYRKKPVVIEAEQWLGYMTPELETFLLNCNYRVEGTKLYIETLEGTMTATFLDYIIRGVEGEFYPCKPDIFEKTYEPVNDEE